MGNSNSNNSTQKNFNDNPKNNNLPNSDIEFGEYFHLIKQQANKFYLENQNNKFNVSISLDKKDFNSPFATKKFNHPEDKKYVYWKDFLSNYLLKKSKNGFEWA